MFRADSSPEIGAGHLMRCIALAQAWQAEGGEVTFLSCCYSPALRRRVTDEGARFIPLPAAHPDPVDWQTTSRFTKDMKPDWLVIDGYHFDPEYQKAACAAGVRVLVIDDTAHLPEYHADILLNQNLGAEKLQYHCDRDTKLLLGTRYVLLRREFLRWRGWQREIPQEARRILVTMGGADADNLTFRVISLLAELKSEGLEVTAVLGTDMPRRPKLGAAVGSSRIPVRVEQDVTDMPKLMSLADVAVAAGGSVAWELAFMGLPAISLIVADNQRAAMRNLAENGAGICAGEARDLDSRAMLEDLGLLMSDCSARAEMASQGQRLVDGDGASRVVRQLLGQPAHTQVYGT